MAAAKTDDHYPSNLPEGIKFIITRTMNEEGDEMNHAILIIPIRKEEKGAPLSTWWLEEWFIETAINRAINEPWLNDVQTIEALVREHKDPEEEDLYEIQVYSEHWKPSENLDDRERLETIFLYLGRKMILGHQTDMFPDGWEMAKILFHPRDWIWYCLFMPMMAVVTLVALGTMIGVMLGLMT